MQKYPLIGISILFAVLLVFGSLTNVVGYQTVQSSNQKSIKDEVNQKELLFQTIIDLVNNKEIQGIIQKSEIVGNLQRPLQSFDVKLLLINLRTGSIVQLSSPPVLAIKYLKLAYRMGVILAKEFSPLKMQLILERFQVNNQGILKEITVVIEKNDKLRGEIKQLSDFKCDCENDNTTVWHFPILCMLLIPLFFILIFLSLITGNFDIYLISSFMEILATILHCY